ncbi:hypothetical protein JJB98_27445 [Bradyrhizobium diazoefficiens]|nr:hypothetical protein [Bradyrhizobium diazoefficiens]QQO23406.1 hypothetical protein JJB98_27445 [Bradyrhizobium diazoefficiens]
MVVHGDVAHRITSYGYLAVTGAVALDVPMPDEATLIAATVLAGTTQVLNIWFVFAGAVGGAILCDNAGFPIGHEIGLAADCRYGGYIG